MSSSYRMDENQYNINMIENELMMDFSYSFMTPVKSEPYLPETANGPYLQIIEEPKQRGFRFRYECEGPSHGGLPGASSEKNKKTYPTVKVCNYVGYARVEVQLVTHTDPPRVHAHSLVGKHCNDSGTCSMDVGPTDLTAQFNNLGILHITKRGVFEVLTKRLREERKKLKGPNSHLTDTEEQAIMKEAKELGNKMDLNVVRLKFTAYLQDGDGGFTRALKPAISKPIYDSKSPNASNLKISRMDKTCGSVLGGDEIFLLCDKVQKDDIDIRFFEDKDGGWEDFGDFSPTDVHKQYAIVFKTPKYHTADIERPVTVFLQLKRRKGDDCSEPKQFTYVPHVQDKEEVQRKKKKPLPHSFDPWNGPSGSSAGTGRGPGSFGGSGGGGNGGFHFNQQLDVGSCFGTIGAFMGGGNSMSGSNAAPETPTEQQQASRAQRGGVPLQRQLLHIASTLQNHTTQMARRTARALLDYCSTGDVRLLLAVQRQLYSVQDENGDTPLHLAVIHQQPAVVQQLVHMIITTQQKVLNMRNHLGQTPLHLAVITKQQRVLDFLLKAGADPTLVDSDGRTVVHLAADVGDENVLRILLTHLGEGHPNLLNSADYHGLHPLHLAVKKGGERCLRALVAAGADVNAAEHKSGNTALHLAVRENLFKVACMLITELKADMNNCTFSGNTPLHLAASQGSPTLCSMLIAAGARKNMENDEPLFLSSSSSEDEDNEDDVERQGKDEPDVALQRPSQSSERPRNPRKRARGHTPFDLARCEKVRAIVDSRDVAKATEKQEEAKPQMDSETLSKLCGILVQGNVSLRQLAEKLGMLTLADLYQESPTPCQNLLENYQLGGGQLEGLVEALQSLGLNEGVKLLREREPQDKAQSTDANVDSGFGSQVMEDVEEGQIQQPVMANP